ncbi:MAG: phosphoesterase [Chloroflexota bacterium]
MTIWFTADTHFGHVNIIRYCNRPCASVTEMDDMLIENWNQAVRPDDHIYHLGDFTMGGRDRAAHYFSCLNGAISIVPGGHDKRWLCKGEYRSKSGHPVTILLPLHTLKLSIPDIAQPQLVVLCHYAMRVWNHSHYGSWHLYGHSHGNLPPLQNSLDVGVDCWDYYPLSLKRVAEEIGKSGACPATPVP